jgi:hypothetical protein
LWADEKPRIEALLKSGHMQLKRAQLANGDLRGRPMWVYMLEQAPTADPPGTSQPYLMFSHPEEITAAEMVSPLTLPSVADVWEFEGKPFLIHFDPVQRQFMVKEFIRPRPSHDSPMGAPVRCTLQHKNDRQGVK